MSPNLQITEWADLLRIDSLQMIGTWFFGLVGAFFLYNQNKILKNQDALLEPLHKAQLHRELEIKLREEVHLFFDAFLKGILQPENFEAQAQDFYRRGMTMQKFEQIKREFNPEITSDRWELISKYLFEAMSKFSENERKRLPSNRALMGLGKTRE